MVCCGFFGLGLELGLGWVGLMGFLEGRGGLFGSGSGSSFVCVGLGWGWFGCLLLRGRDGEGGMSGIRLDGLQRGWVNRYYIYKYN